MEVSGAGTLLTLVGELSVTTPSGRLTGGRIGSRRGRLLLSLLAAERRAVVSTDRIADVLWPQHPPGQPDADIATLVSRLRRAVGAGVVVGDRRSGYRLGDPAHVTLDLDRAADLVSEASRRLETGEAGIAATAAAAAAAILSGGAAVAEAPDADWASTVRGEQAVLARRVAHLRSAAALQLGDPDAARSLAAAAVADDPFDEGAARDLMAAHLAAGQHAAALQVYDRLRRSLADEFGADPSAATAQLHLAVLRGDASTAPVADPVAAPEPARSPVSRAGRRDPGSPASPGTTIGPPLPLVGRTGEVQRVHAAWDAAADGWGELLLLTGAAGVGKTRLATHAVELAAETGGFVLTARAVAAERSLFLQPVAEALGGLVTRLPAREVVRATRGRTRLLSRLLPDLPVDEREDAVESGNVEVERLRTFEAVVGFIKEVATVAPVLLVLDDLHEAGLSTLELVHYLARQAGRLPLLVVGTVRSPQGAHVLDLLADTARRLELGPLGPDAVAELADAAGHPERATEIVRRTRGHALYVVELLRDLDSGAGGLSASLRESVLARVRRSGPHTVAVVRAGSVLGRAFDPVEAGTLAGVPLPRALEACEGALLDELLETDGPRYLFVHDLVREAVYASIPEPTRVALHRAAADLSVDQPELEAWHASAAGDLDRAARASLAAGELALRRYAAADAKVLASHALDAAESLGAGSLGAESLATESLRARALLLRARAGEAGGAYEQALVDYSDAVRSARSSADLRLELDTQFGLGGDVHMALGRPLGHADAALARALEIARELEDHGREVEALGKLAQAAVFRLRHDDAVSFSSMAMAMTRRGDGGFARLAALTSRMVTVGALGEVTELHEVVDELEPLMRRSGDLWLLQFVLSNAATVPLAAEDYGAAERREREALELNRRTGHAAQEAYFLTRLALQRRLAGDVEGAVQLGREAVATGRRAGTHLWWSVGAATDLACSLMAADRDDEALEVLTSIVPEGEWENERRLWVLAPLARASGSRVPLERADSLLRAVATPPGSAWIVAGDLYIDVATAWRRVGEPARAAEVAGRLAEAARRNAWPAWERLAASLL